MTNMIVTDAAFCNEGDPDQSSGTVVEVLTRTTGGGGAVADSHFAPHSLLPTMRGIGRARAMTATATARRRRGEARLDKRFKPKMSEKASRG
jgi:hypothetical protein